MVSRTMLLSIWDLEEKDEVMVSELTSGVEWLKDNTRPQSVTARTTVQLHNRSAQSCHSCGNLNEQGSSWCAECGVCLLEQQHEGVHIAHKEEGDGNTASLEHVMDQLDLTLSSKTESCPSKTRSPYKRKWSNSSRFHMWQKPSSLKRTSTSPIYSETKSIVLSQEQPLYWSLLDLPDELILFILSFLSPLDITTCASVCWRLRQVTFDTTLYSKFIP